MAIKALLYGWATCLIVSWLTSLGIFYSDIALGSDLHRWLPVIARAEGYFVAHDQLDFLKKTAWIYEKDLALQAFMLVWLALFSWFSLKVRLHEFFKLGHYRHNYLALLLLLVCIFMVATVVLGPDIEPSTRGRWSNRLYEFSVIFGAFHSTLVLFPLMPMVAMGFAVLLDSSHERLAAWRRL
ncbi:hypothetical protein [Pseudomonas vanderleydeniana]|uniref:Uncharacterized protein n=1 Tax=Pseudomonas vanderleydeniana TaxID=2745495 RepID=A0A9E6PH19_9PSED|nr:hypothetical protein [Pseudomonas vanderleydeniana]QXI26080.1 hypothetical protein HU752_019155 [Pseudomonas vanderleydeniana]